MENTVTTKTAASLAGIHRTRSASSKSAGLIQPRTPARVAVKATVGASAVSGLRDEELAPARRVSESICRGPGARSANPT